MEISPTSSSSTPLPPPSQQEPPSSSSSISRQVETKLSSNTIAHIHDENDGNKCGDENDTINFDEDSCCNKQIELFNGNICLYTYIYTHIYTSILQNSPLFILFTSSISIEKCDPSNDLSISAVSDMESSLAIDKIIETEVSNESKKRLTELEQKCAQLEEIVSHQKLEMFDLIENVSKSMKAAFEDSRTNILHKEQRKRWMYSNLHEKRKIGKFHSTVASLNYDGTQPTRRIRKPQELHTQVPPSFE